MFEALAARMHTGAVGEADGIAASHLYLTENAGTVLTVDGGFTLAGSRTIDAAGSSA